MGERDWLVERFEAERPQLQAMAYRMLGSLPEAQDAVQESWLHLVRADRSEVSNLGAWLTTAVARICLDMLRARKVLREESLEASDPESLIRELGGIDPEEEAELADSVGLALLLLRLVIRGGKMAEIEAVADPAHLHQVRLAAPDD